MAHNWKGVADRLDEIGNDTRYSAEFVGNMVRANLPTILAALRSTSTDRFRVGKKRLSDRDRAILTAVATIGPDAGSEAVGAALGYKFPASVEACRQSLNAMASGGWLEKSVRPTTKTRRAYYSITPAGRTALNPSASEVET